MSSQPVAQVGASLPLQTSLVLGALPSAVPCARLHARNVMHEWDLASTADTVELVVSELVTNAVQASTGLDAPLGHGMREGLSCVHLRLSTNRARVLIEVWDHDPCLPMAEVAGPDDESGRGLMLTEALCERWDCAQVPEWDGKVVWAELRAGTAEPFSEAGSEL